MTEAERYYRDQQNVQDEHDERRRMMEESAVVPLERTQVLPASEVQISDAQATEIARALKTHVTEQGWSMRLQGKDYLLSEAWTYIGGRFGLFPKTRFEPIIHGDDILGYKAQCDIIDRRTGDVVSGAEHACFLREGNRSWTPNHAIGMAQTRAVARAFMQDFRWLAKLSGFEGTPAEEMAGVESERPSTKPLPPKPTSAKISEAQRKRLWAIASANVEKQMGDEEGKSDATEAMLRQILREVGLESTKDIERAQYDGVVQRAETFDLAELGAAPEVF